MKRTLGIVVIILFLAFPVWAAQLLVTWDANTDGITTGYNVYYAPPSKWDGLAHNGIYPQVFDAGNATTYTIPDIEEGAHGITVTAYDAAGNESDGGAAVSVFFNEVSLQTAPSPTVTSEPAGIVIEVQ